LTKCVVVASIASRKSVAIAKSIKDLLGFKVVGIAHTVHPHIFSRIFDKRHMVKVPRESVKWPLIVAEITSRYGCKAVIPVDYIDFYMFSKYLKLFSERDIIVTAPPHESIVLASDRVRIVEILSDVAKFPKQVFIREPKDANAIYRLKPPIVVKNLGDASNPSFHIDYEPAIAEASKRAPCIVQEYIEGVGRGYYAIAYNGEPLLEFMHQRRVEYIPIGGASLLAEGNVKDPELVALGRRILRRLAWSGAIMIETRLSNEHGEYFVIELNPKFWGSIDLPVSLGYHFPAVLLTSFIHGHEKAREIAQRLFVRNGSFAWLLDGFRLLPKVPSTWFYILRNFLSNPLQSDARPADPAKNLVQVAIALSRFGREKRSWIKYLSSSSIELRYWVKRLAHFLRQERKVLVLDFDETLVHLPIDWQSVRKQMIRLGLVNEWESLNRTLARLWRTNKEAYHRLSDAIVAEEQRCIGNGKEIKLLIPRETLENLARHATLCIATKQTTSVTSNVLEMLDLKRFISTVIGRDSGVGPIKINMYRKCLEQTQSSTALVIDDNIEAVIDAYREGFVPILVSSNEYRIARSIRLGIPAGDVKKVSRFILHLLSSN
jgi:phosphoglycolate phosphatase-like HAD superfamily hydrolase